MNVRIISFDGCPNATPAQEFIQQVANELSISVEIESVQVNTNDEAHANRMLGSPTIQVEGLDIDPNARRRKDFVMSCRVFDGHHGLPPRAMIENALHECQVIRSGENER